MKVIVVANLLVHSKYLLICHRGNL